MINLKELKIHDSMINTEIIINFLKNCKDLKKLDTLIIIKDENRNLNMYYYECLHRFPVLKKISSLIKIILTK